MDDSRDARRREPRRDSQVPVMCPVCSKTLGERSSLKRHMRSSHYKHFTKDAFETQWEQIKSIIVSEQRMKALNRQRRLENSAAADAAASRSTRHPGGIQLGAAQNSLYNSPTTSALSSLFPLSFGSTNPIQLTVSPASTEFNYLSASSSSSQQQSPAIAQVPSVNFPGLSPIPQQPIDIIQALLSNRNNLTTTQLENSIQQLFASNIPGLPNAPQQAPWIQQPLGLNIPGPSNTPQQNTGIAQALEMIQQQFRVNPVPSMTQPLRVTVEDVLDSSARSLLDGLRLNPLLSTTGNVTTVTPGDTEVKDPTASTSQQRIDEPNVPGTSSGQREESPEPKVFKPYQPHRGPNL